MKIFHPYFVGLGLAAAALSSCERSYYSSYYSYQSKTPAHLGSVPTTTAPLAAPLTPATDEADPEVSAVVLMAPVPEPGGKVALAALPKPTMAPVVSSPAVTVAPASVAKPSPVLRLALRGLAKQAAKATARQQNTAGVTQTAARGKGSITVAIVGLAALIVGIIVSSGFLITIGIILLVIGVVLYLLKLL